MDVEVNWSEPSFADFETIIRDLAVESPTAAEKLRQEILSTAALLARFPFIGPVYDRDRRRGAREILCGKYRIFYRVRRPEGPVEILTLWHSSRQEPRLPK